MQGPEKSELKRDFTYIDDIVDGIMGALAEIPPSEKRKAHYKVLDGPDAVDWSKYSQYQAAECITG